MATGLTARIDRELSEDEHEAVFRVLSSYGFDDIEFDSDVDEPPRQYVSGGPKKPLNTKRKKKGQNE